MCSLAPYKTIDGKWLYRKGLKTEEKRLLAEIERAYRRHPGWAQFTNFWRAKVRELYRNLPPKERTSTVVYLIGEDLEARLGVAQKHLRSPDFRDQLNQVIFQDFQSRYAFCRATGLDQGFVSRLLRKSTDISVERLNRALERIGWEVRLNRPRDIEHKPKRSGKTNRVR